MLRTRQKSVFCYYSIYIQGEFRISGNDRSSYLPSTFEFGSAFFFFLSVEGEYVNTLHEHRSMQDSECLVEGKSTFSFCYDDDEWLVGLSCEEGDVMDGCGVSRFSLSECLRRLCVYVCSCNCMFCYDRSCCLYLFGCVV